MLSTKDYSHKLITPHMHYMHIYIYIYMCVCVCVYKGVYGDSADTAYARPSHQRQISRMFKRNETLSDTLHRRRVPFARFLLPKSPITGQF